MSRDQFPDDRLQECKADAIQSVIPAFLNKVQNGILLLFFLIYKMCCSNYSWEGIH